MTLPPERLLIAGREEDLGPDDIWTVRVSHGRRGRPRWAVVLRDGDGHIRAYLNECRHLPIPLDGGGGRFLTPDGKRLLCSTHGATYRREDGYCVEGPCHGMSLHRVHLRVVGGLIHLVDPPQ